MQRKALFLDRDGTINTDHGYVYRQEDFDFIPGIFELCARARDLGYLIIVITNQSGIARGYYTEADYEQLTAYMVEQFAARGIHLADVLHCPELSGPDRKPEPGMFLRAAARHGLDMAACVSVGDKPRDVEAAERAGCGRNFLYQDTFTPIIQAL